jgi:hypothetical protein
MKQLCMAIMILWSASVAAESSVVVGRPSKHFSIDAKVPCPQGDENAEYICMDAWIGWEINITETLSGPKITGRVRAARIQHANFVPKYLRKFSLFVLTPIDTVETRKLLGADYLLAEVSQGRTMHCFDRPPDAYGLDDYVLNLRGSATAVNPGYCFELQEGRRQ